MSIDAQPALFDLSLDDVPHSSPEQRDDTTILIESWAGAKNRIGRHDVARQAVQETSLTAQEELGGGPYQQRVADLPTPKRLDEAIRGSEDWHSDIIDAVERFGLNDITTTFLDSSKDVERLKYLLHVVKFMQCATSHMKQIQAVDGDVSLAPRIYSFVDRARTKSPTEMREYADKIEHMLGGLRELQLTERLCEVYSKSGRKTSLKKCLEKVDFRQYQVEFFANSPTKEPMLKQRTAPASSL